MKLIVCLDDHNGMLFNNRRQSMDAQVRRRMLILAGGKLWMSQYSAGQFAGEVGVAADAAFLEKAGENDWCFLEDGDIAPFAQHISRVVIYRWNRVYPADVSFPIHLFEDRWRLEASLDFPGNSHERITQEVYSL